MCAELCGVFLSALSAIAISLLELKAGLHNLCHSNNPGKVTKEITRFKGRNLFWESIMAFLPCYIECMLQCSKLYHQFHLTELRGRCKIKKSKTKLTSVSFAFTHTYTLEKLTLLLFFPQAYMENFEKCAKSKRKKHFIVPCYLW